MPDAPIAPNPAESWCLVGRMTPTGLLPARRVTLHAARIGSSPTPTSLPSGGGEPAFGPIRPDLHNMAAAVQCFDGGLRQTAFDNQHAGPRCARPKRERRMLAMPGRGINCFLQIETGMDVSKKKLGRPLVLLIAARGTPSQVRLAVAQRQRR